MHRIRFGMKGTTLYTLLSISMRHIAWSFLLSLMSQNEGSSSRQRFSADHLALSVCNVILRVKLLGGRHGKFYNPHLSNHPVSSWILEYTETETFVSCMLLTIELSSA